MNNFNYTGMIFIINEYNEITAYLKLRRPIELINVANFCLDDFGDKITHFHHDTFENKITIRVYQTQSKIPQENNKPNSSNRQLLPLLPYKMQLIEQKELQTNYFPGKYTYNNLHKEIFKK